MNKISNERMSAFLETIISQVRTALFEREEDILRAWHENISEANENEDKFPELKLSIAATVDLEANKIETCVSFTTRYKSTVSESLPDPDQPDLPVIAEMANNLGKMVKDAGAKITVN